MTTAEHQAIYRSYELDSLLAVAPNSSYASFGLALNRESRTAREAGDSPRAQLLNLLASVMLAYVDETSPQHTFQRMNLEEERFPTPQELHDAEVEQLRTVVAITQNGVLQARLLDMLWHSRHQVRECVAAVAGYLASAEADPSTTMDVARLYRRAIGLARSLGWRQAIFREATQRLLARTLAVAGTEVEGFFFCQLVKIVEEYAPAASRQLIEPVLARARAAGHRNDHYEAEQYFQLSISLLRGWREEARVREVQVELGECFVQRAEQFAREDAGAVIGATTWMARGIEELERGKAPRDRIDALRARLEVLQQASLDNFTEFSLPDDLEQQMREERERNEEKVRAAVSGKPFKEALIRLAIGLPMCSAEQLRTTVQELAEQAPLMSMMAATIVDERGRTVVVDPGLPIDSADLEAAMLIKMCRHAAQWTWPPRADLIAAGVYAILEEHRPSLEELAFLVRSSPWVAEGHEEIVLRGLHAGLHGEWLLSAHLLVPQFEASLRNLLAKAGVVVANLEDGVEEDQTLGALLNRRECLDIIGPDWQFELRGLLSEKAGLNFRNELAHGLLTSNQCRSVAAVNLWWIMVRACVALTRPARKPPQQAR